MRILAVICALVLASCAKYQAPTSLLGLLLRTEGSAPLTWWSPAFRARRTLTISNTGSSLTGIPVLVHLTSPNFSFGHARVDGSDICFVSAEGSQLPFEKDVFLAGDASFWVRLDLPPGETTLYMYYSSDSVCPVTGSVWTSGYRAVYHLSSTPLAALRDSAGTNHLTATGMTNANLVASTTTQGLRFNGAQFLSAPDSTTLRLPGEGSLEILFQSDPYSLGAHYLIEKGSNDFDNYSLYIKNAGSFGCAAVGGCFAFEFRDAAFLTDVTGSIALPHSQVTSLAVNLNNSAQRLEFFLDGSLVESIPAPLPGNGWPHPLVIGVQNFGSTFPFSGIIDEVRVSSLVRDPDYYRFVNRNLRGITPQISSEENL